MLLSDSRMRLELILIAAGAALTAMQPVCLAQNPVETFASRAASSRVSFDYSLKMQSSVALSGSGTVLFEGDGYRIQGNGVTIVSDGATRWTLDEVSREAYIETVQESGAYLAANPVALLRRIGDAFTQVGTSTARNYTAVEMVPAAEGSGIRTMTVRFSGQRLSGADITTDDGTVTAIDISKLVFSDPAGEDFTVDTSALGSDWVVTDLR